MRSSNIFGFCNGHLIQPKPPEVKAVKSMKWSGKHWYQVIEEIRMYTGHLYCITTSFL